MRIAVVFNAQAGTAGRIKDVLATLSGRRQYDLWPTNEPGDAARLGRRAREEGIDRLVVAGGDGTIGQVANGLAPDFEACEVAVLPLGTGNDLARSLGIYPAPLAQAANWAFDRPAIPIDIMRAAYDGQSWYVVNAATGGFGGTIAADVQQADKQRWGAFAYWMTAVSHLVRLQEHQVRLELDGKPMDLATFGLAVANGRFVGGGFPIAPTALLNDGLLDVTTVPVLPTLELLAAGLSFSLNPTTAGSRVKAYQAENVRIHAEPELPFSLDGEPTRSLDAEFQVVRQSLRVVPGPTPVALGPH